MPGGRLTHQDRRRIASGLAEGLGYAEIARRLGRPTSTITREVMRNGGAADYRADQAHRAAGQRARRRKPVRSPAQPPVLEDTVGRDPEAVRDFEERFTAVILQTGLPRMAARVLASLYVTDSGCLTAAELVQRLRVSPASISKAIGYLEGDGLELVRRERGGGRRERYIVDDDVWFRAWLASARANDLWADTARQGAAVFGTDTPAGARLDAMAEFFGLVGQDMAGVAELWWQNFQERRR
ncbi:GbsR/MarR family transcriptional regulator [Amycolatopsis anabasis]|uniref:GbsR/MarR family transcriptional regulator n=1 Tax=Amycolatopsis anabasis TaxID=1840409 RepID=UPI00131A9207|nr:helix-turn-helix domain-containing protein [Amycolatopsis anabasis]